MFMVVRMSACLISFCCTANGAPTELRIHGTARVVRSMPGRRTSMYRPATDVTETFGNSIHRHPSAHLTPVPKTLPEMAIVSCWKAADGTSLFYVPKTVDFETRPRSRRRGQRSREGSLFTGSPPYGMRSPILPANSRLCRGRLRKYMAVLHQHRVTALAGRCNASWHLLLNALSSRANHS